jgi:hypothetical protein
MKTISTASHYVGAVPNGSTNDGTSPVPNGASGWYPDPDGSHDLRYYNGQTWTGDVSTAGIRAVEPLGAGDSIAPGPSGVVPMVLGIVSMTIAWIPLICFVGLGLAIAAIALGFKRRKYPSAASGSTVGIVTGLVGILFAVGGIWLSVSLLQAVERFEKPGNYTATVTDCTVADGKTQAVGTISNLENDERSYTIEVSFDNRRSATTTVHDIPPGGTAEFVVTEDLRMQELECTVSDVKGPRPFGIDLDSGN